MGLIKRGRPKKAAEKEDVAEEQTEVTEERKDFECPECGEEISLEIDKDDDLVEGVLTDCPACGEEVTLCEKDLKEDEDGEGEDDEKGAKVSKKKLPEIPSPSVTQSSQMSAQEMLVVAEDYITRASELIKSAREIQ